MNIRTEDYMTNAMGHLVPKANVSDKDQLQDRIVNEMCAKAAEKKAEIDALKREAFDDVDAFVDMIVEHYGAKRLGGKKGNIRLMSYDGMKRVDVKVDTLISFGPELVAARELIDACIESWCGGANDHLVTLVNDAFRTNGDGRLSAGRVLGLRRLDIDDPQWQMAMSALGDAVTVTGSKRYVRFYERKSGDDEFEQIPLG